MSTEGLTGSTTSTPRTEVDLISAGKSCCVPIGPDAAKASDPIAAPNPAIHEVRQPNPRARIASSKVVRRWGPGCF